MRIWSSILVALSVSIPMAQGVQPPHQWSVVQVLGAPAEGDAAERILWVGVRNGAGNPRLVCLSGWAFTIEDSKQTRVGGEGSPHACSEEASYSPVLAGETRFVQVPFAREEWLTESATLHLDVFLSEVGPGGFTKRRAVTLAWSGRYSQALQASRRLFHR